MYPGVIVEYNDQSDIPVVVPVTEVRDQPLFMALFTSDKGPEEWTRISGSDFFDAYGKTISFTRHGQPLLQAAMTINAGAELLCKRLVASDATLAHVGIVAELISSTVDNVDENGNVLYVDADGNTTTESADADGNAYTKLTTNTVEIKYSTAFASTGVKTIEEAKTSIEAGLSEGQYLLYVIGDNGRGTSRKRIKIVPNYKLSKSLTYTLYTLSVIEGTTELESMTFSANPNIVVNNENISLMSMIRTHSKQLTCINNDTGMEAFATKLAETVLHETYYGNTVESSDDIYTYDILFGRTNKGEEIAGVSVSSTGVDLQYTYGQQLTGGDNGKFGDYPFKDDTTTDENGQVVTGPIRAEYISQAVAALDGTFDTVIFNVDQYMVDALVDANYPVEVKRAIETLAVFREDFVYFRDLGIGKTDIALIEEGAKSELKDKFCASYCQSYDILDPYTKRQITVTIGYDLAQRLVAHCNNGSILPTAGMKYNMVISNAIYGTLSFAPTICPDVNQKELLEDMHMNYASYIDNQLVIESLYTSQDKNSQWSYINNVMGIQEVVKAIRTRCPAIRYTFIDGDDLERYKAEVEEVIAPYKSNFKELSLEFAADSTYSANKIFYAVLKVVYNDFVQTEWFKVTALSAVEVVNA